MGSREKDMFENFPNRVTIRDMGPREGLQSEPNIIPTDKKINLIRALLKAGFKYIQVTSFVSPEGGSPVCRCGKAHEATGAPAAG
jgi:isopropylmalate/homocitrate/citramalate synthase